MRRGLVVGKFMPLHRGHQFLIETALANVDELVIVVYDIPGVAGAGHMPIEKRMKWITDLYPNVHAIIPRKDPIYDPLYREHDDPVHAYSYAANLRSFGPFTHVFSSEDYGEPFARSFTSQQVRADLQTMADLNSLKCSHVMVDAAREMMPVSGTMLRENPYLYRAYVDPLVYRSLIQKVVFVGTESTGKSTLAKALAERHRTMHTEEYGRTLWIQNLGHGIKHTFRDLYDVAVTQYEQEQAAALHSNRYLFCDTNAWTTLMWSEMYYDTADARLYDLVDRTKHEYQWFFCEDDFEWVDDGSRELKGERAHQFSRRTFDRLLSTLPMWDSRWQLWGPLEQRIEQVEEVLGLNVAVRS